MNEKRVIMEWTAKAPTWGQIVNHYQARPGLINWLSDRMPVLRGEIEDRPVPEMVGEQE